MCPARSTPGSGQTRSSRWVACPIRCWTARATSYSYRQSNVYWNRVAVTINEWGDKGWEFVQAVPVINPNPGAGGEMQVVIVFRRPAG